MSVSVARMADEADRMGADITAADMVPPQTEPSKIQEFYAGSTVMITGATGFLGKLILEKVMRTCPGVRKIYVLIRAKKDKSAEQRFAEFFDNVVSLTYWVLFTSRILIPLECV